MKTDAPFSEHRYGTSPYAIIPAPRLFRFAASRLRGETLDRCWMTRDRLPDELVKRPITGPSPSATNPEPHL